LPAGGNADGDTAMLETVGTKQHVTQWSTKGGPVVKPGTYPTVEQRAAQGKAARAAVARESQAQWTPGQRTLEPLDLLTEQAETRVPELVPIRYGRMAESPFAYYRGAALPMAADLATMAHSGLLVQLCGDAHLSNFGGFASPEREMLFDVNDFDETSTGPFEWDVKRLAASLEVAARGRGFDPKIGRNVVLGGVRSYQQAVRTFAGSSNLAVWYSRLDLAEVSKRWGGGAGKKMLEQTQRSVAKAETKDQLKAGAKLTRLVDGELRFVSDPPLVVPVRELYSGAEGQRVEESIQQAVGDYRRTLPGECRHLLESYRVVDQARKVVGVGSVGTRAWIVLFVGRDNDDTLILQVKEAEASVLERFLAKSPFNNHGQRVVEGQRLMQTASDIFLGWQRIVSGADGRPHDYYVRQLWDWKLSANVATMAPDVLGVYAQVCGWALGLGHARSGDAVAIGSYLGGSDVFALALADFAHAYADQNDRDHQALVSAIAAGTVKAETGV
jgi:uncharacterized protein (DUF2252 family)